jgi:hypothetical protein
MGVQGKGTADVPPLATRMVFDRRLEHHLKESQGMVTRKNRQTGTMITVGRSSDLGVNGGDGWALICEDHGMVMHVDTRKLADWHAVDPMGWCEVCNGTIEQWAADLEPMDGETV